MKKDVVIDITGVEIIDDEDEKVSVITTGVFYKKEESYYIVYNEILENKETQKTTLKVKNNDLVSMTRFGDNRTQLVIESGIRHQCFYQTEYGGITIGIMGDEIKNTLTDDGGELFFSYTLDINTNLSSEHKLTIKVRPA
ncbi:MAG: DUF1934 domain-containing protein [Oscillospiraceae bacterium]